MPTARELLEQADALMRRNRKRGKGRLDDVPTLTAALGVDDEAPMAPTVMLPDRANADGIVPGDSREGGSGSDQATADFDSMPLDTLSDVPVLTDEVPEWPPPAHADDAAMAQGDDAGVAAGDAFPNSAADAEIAAAESPPAAIPEDPPDGRDREPDPAAVPPSRTPAAPIFEDEFILDIPPAEDEAADRRAAGGDAPAAPVVSGLASPSPGSAEWDALAEEIRMQVLQRLDLFTDTGLRDQLGARLRPIVERASTELIATINRQLGELVRGYVAEAIEREIESWRKRNG